MKKIEYPYNYDWRRATGLPIAYWVTGIYLNPIKDELRMLLGWNIFDEFMYSGGGYRLENYKMWFI